MMMHGAYGHSMVSHVVWAISALILACDALIHEYGVLFDCDIERMVTGAKLSDFTRIDS